MKRLLRTCALFALAATLTACGSNHQNDSASESSKQESVESQKEASSSESAKEDKQSSKEESSVQESSNAVSESESKGTVKTGTLQEAKPDEQGNYHLGALVLKPKQVWKQAVTADRSTDKVKSKVLTIQLSNPTRILNIADSQMDMISQVTEKKDRQEFIKSFLASSGLKKSEAYQIAGPKKNKNGLEVYGASQGGEPEENGKLVTIGAFLFQGDHSYTLTLTGQGELEEQAVNEFSDLVNILEITQAQ